VCEAVAKQVVKDGAMAEILKRNKIRVMLVDDHAVIREGIKGFIRCADDIVVVAETGQIDNVQSLIKTNSPEVVIVDIGIGEHDGIELTRLLVSANPDIKVIVFTMHEEALYADSAVSSGARAFLSKNREPADLIEAIRCVARGEMYFDERMRQHLLGKLCKIKKTVSDRIFVEELLTLREQDVLRLMGEGCDSDAIASRLHIARKTVATHRANMMHKLRIDNMSKLMHFAFAWTGQDAQKKGLVAMPKIRRR
jgi:DNA-binding NarL/FixJ family response regulator